MASQGVIVPAHLCDHLQVHAAEVHQCVHFQCKKRVKDQTHNGPVQEWMVDLLWEEAYGMLLSQCDGTHSCIPQHTHSVSVLVWTHVLEWSTRDIS